MKKLGSFILFLWDLQDFFLCKEEYCKATAISCTGHVTLPQLQLLSYTSLCAWEGRQFVLHNIFGWIFSVTRRSRSDGSR